MIKKSNIFLTFDIEPYWTSIPERYDRSAWDTEFDQSREMSLSFINFCLHYNFNATVFIVGEWARRNPDIVKTISSLPNFKIGSHSYWHEDLSRKSDSEFIQDVQDSKEVLQDITGEEVVRFRAPSFSILPRQIALLSEVGYKIDSSLTQAIRAYGANSQGVQAVDAIKEVPFIGSKLVNRELTLLGGGYLRMMPVWLLRSLAPYDLGNMVYLHPHDIPKYVPAYSKFTTIENLRKRVRVGSMFKKLEILSTFKCMVNF